MMHFIKKLIPNSIKQEGKYFLYDLLKMPYSRHGVGIEILKWLPPSQETPITFVDIGASIGSFAWGITKEYRIKKGVLIEPLVKHIPLLSQKFATENFEVINAAVADFNGETDFYINDDFDSISSLLKIHHEHSGLVNFKIAEPQITRTKTLTLDRICIDLQIDSIDLLKIDVQGAEHLVIKGAAEALKSTRLVYTEVSFQPLYKGSSTFPELYNLLNEQGFALIDLNKGYSSPQGELLQGDAFFINKKFI